MPKLSCLAFLVPEDVEGQLWAEHNEPLLDGEAIALGFGDTFAILVQKQLVIESLGRRAPSMRAIFELWVTESIRSCPPSHNPRRVPPSAAPNRPSIAAWRHRKDRLLDGLAGCGLDIADGADDRSAISTGTCSTTPFTWLTGRTAE